MPKGKHVSIIDGKKQCTKCKEWFPATTEYFYANSSSSVGLKHRCKKCMNEEKEEWRRRKGYKELSERRRGYRKQILMHYGNGDPKCVVCGVRDERVLDIDHIYNDGAKQKKELGWTCTDDFYSYLVKNNFPSGYQILCKNHNWLKYRCGGKLPEADELMESFSSFDKPYNGKTPS